MNDAKWNNPGKYWTAGMRALKWKIQNNVEADLRALISARLQIQLVEKSKVYADQRLDAYRKNNEVGTATIQDVINAENDSSSADNAQLEAVETFAGAVTKLWKDTGVLLERSNIHIDALVPQK
jgi:outer membrane protein